MSVASRRVWCRVSLVALAVVLVGSDAAANASAMGTPLHGAAPAAVVGASPDDAGSTVVATSGSLFTINGAVTHEGTSAAGMLVNMRMINGLFSDANPKTVWRWKYPDTGTWDPNRNTGELIAALPTYHAYGVDAITVGLQGGLPVRNATVDQTWNVSAFTRTGALKTDWMERLDHVLTAADALHMVVIVSLFYQAQDQRLADDAAVVAACDNVTDWLTTTGPHAPYRDVLVEVANEINSTGYDRAVLTPDRVVELIQRIHDRSGGTLPVSTSFRGRSIPTAAVVAASQYVLLHSSGLTADQLAAAIATIRAMPEYTADPKPILVTEDGVSSAAPTVEDQLAKMDTALGAGAGWGYYDQGLPDYHTGFQTVPINWGITTPHKQAFFDRTAWWTSQPAG
jgi:hypothetical protein